jgi:peroxiredoxin Q/BCP
VELQSRFAELEDLGVAVWAISGDDPERLRSFRDREGIEYRFLLDPEGSTFGAYGIVNERSDRTVPHPTVVVVDSARAARFVASDENYRVRPAAGEVVAAVRRALEDAAAD